MVNDMLSLVVVASIWLISILNGVYAVGQDRLPYMMFREKQRQVFTLW